MNKKLLSIFLLIPFYSLAQQGLTVTNERLRIADAMERSLNTELLAKWYPQCVDSVYGGFLSGYSFDFKPLGPQDKFIVTQARHMWTTAKAALLYPEKKYYLRCAKQGFDFLKNVMWDKKYGGFYNLVTREGNDKSNPLAEKEAYGNAFAIYALAAYYKASGDTAALSLAKTTFNWLEAHSHDATYKGYYQHLHRDGSIVKRDASLPSTSDIGYKDQNSSIHLLEAFTSLYEVWPDPLLRSRLEEMLYLVRDRLTNQKGSLILFFQPDWTPLSFRDSSEAVILQHKYLDHVSFGHDVETAYLMLEATHALGNKNDSITLLAGKKMLDHALKNGWDNSLGGFYDEGYYFKGSNSIRIIFDSKNWWAQSEGMNTLLLMAGHFPDDDMHYYDHFKKLWQYVQTYLVDHEHGGWYEEGSDKEPQRKTAPKGHIWKGTYHNFRALENCMARLRSQE